MEKFYCIELLRFFTSLAVVIRHYIFFFYPRSSSSTIHILTDSSILPFYPLLQFIYEMGDYAVPIFWAISGFVFALVYLEQKENVSGKKFFINRFARLYPLHFATLIIVTVLQLININLIGKFQIYPINDIHRFILNLFFVSGWEYELLNPFFKGASFNGPIWSVSVEILIYVIFFFSIIHIKKYKIKYAIAVYGIALLVDKLMLSSLFIDCYKLFFSGIIVYYINLKIKRKSLLLLSSLLLISISFIGNFKIFLFGPGLLLFFVYLETFNINKFKEIFQFLGNLTYSMYLLHIPIMLFIIINFYIINISDKIFLSIYFFIFYLILIMFLSFISFKYYEKPLNYKIRTHFN